MLKGLADELDHALYGHDPNRARSRELAHEMRTILAGAEKSLDSEHVEPIRLFVDNEHMKALRVFGTSGWDEPTRPASNDGLRVGFADKIQDPSGPHQIVTGKLTWATPLTDRELDALAGDKLENDGDSMRFYALDGDQLCLWGCGGRAARLGRERSEDEGHRPHCPIYRLVAEVRRLRSDEWLKRAALEIADIPLRAGGSRLEILRKHRDGKA